MVVTLLFVLSACAPSDPKSGAPDPVDSGSVVDSGADSGPDSDTQDSHADSGPREDSGDPDTDTETDTAAEAAAARSASCGAFVAAAEAFLAALDAEQRATVAFPLEDGSRARWSNLPVPSVPRDGLAIEAMTEPQRALAWGLLEAGLSASGYAQARQIVDIDEWWATDMGNAMLGERFYTFALYGTPSVDAPWAFQLDGHHLVYNLTASCADDAVVMAPNLLGVQPTTGPDGSAIAGVRAMDRESDAALAFMESLTEAQRAFAITSDTNDLPLIAGPGGDDRLADAEGILGADLAPDQRALLLELLAAWLEDQDEPFAVRALADAEAALDDTALLWQGAVAADGAFYYRVRGPTVYIELDWAGPDHIHAVLRDPMNDYGVDVLAAHRARFPHP